MNVERKKKIKNLNKVQKLSHGHVYVCTQINNCSSFMPKQ